MRDDLRLSSLIVSVALLLAALIPRTFSCAAGAESLPGWQVAMLGPIGILGLEPRWYANLALAHTWYRLAKPTRTGRLLWASVVLLALAAVSAIYIPSPLGCLANKQEFASESLALGGWLWVASAGTSIAGCLVTLTPHQLTSNT